MPVGYRTACSAAIFAVSLGCGFLPLAVRSNRRVLSLANAFAGGIFLAGGLVHLLSEAATSFATQPSSSHHHDHHHESISSTAVAAANAGVNEHHEHHGSGTVAYILCACGFLLTFFVEKIIMMRDVKAEERDTDETELLEHSEEAGGGHHGHSHGADIVLRMSSQQQSSLLPYMLTLVLALHSVIAGLALGIQDDAAKGLLVFLAIISHKWIESFALGISIVRSNATITTHWRLVTAFSCTTPLGVLFGWVLESLMEGAAEDKLTAGLSALASGTFIYIAVVDTLIEEFAVAKDKYVKFLLVLIGFAMMVILSSYFDVHAH